MKLKKTGGMVTYSMKAGTDMVEGTMSVEAAERIIATGKSKDLDDTHFMVDEKYIFEGVKEASKPEKKKR